MIIVMFVVVVVAIVADTVLIDATDVASFIFDWCQAIFPCFGDRCSCCLMLLLFVIVAVAAVVASFWLLI